MTVEENLIHGDPIAKHRPLYMQIYQYYRDALVKGQIPLNERLPSIRRLAQHLSISRNPVEAAYSQLIAEGYLVGKPKSGYYPAALEWQFPTGSKASPFLLQAESSPRPEKNPMITFDYDRTDVMAFPLDAWRRITQKVLQGTASDLLHYGDRLGEPGLREQIAIHISQQRGIRCEAEQIIITSGTQQAVILLSGLLANEASERKLLRIGVEAAMHPGVLHVLRHQRLEVVPIELESDGLSLSVLEAAPNVQAVYVTPSRQFPYGMVMPAAKRLQLLNWAHKKQVFLIEDDYDHDFLYEGRPIPALQGLDIHGSVVYLGTFSKSLAPGLRLGYIVLPPRLLKRFEHELPHYDQTASRLTQKTMELFMAQGFFDRHVRRMRKRYKAKRDILLEEIARHLGSRVRLSGISSGLHVILEWQGEEANESLMQKAATAGVRLQPVSAFHVNAEEASNRSQSFVLGFGGLSEAEIREGISRLATAWASAH